MTIDTIFPIRGIEGRTAHGDSSRDDRHPDLKADFILANPPFNVSDWGGGEGAGDHADVPGLCRSATLEEVRKHGHVPTPGRHVGAEAPEEDGEPFEDRMKRLVSQLREQQTGGARPNAAVAANIETPGFGDGR